MVSGVFTSMLGAMSPVIAVDIGTTSTRVALAGKGVVCDERSAALVHQLPASQPASTGRRRLLALGTDAWKMLGRTPPDRVVVQPVREGVIEDFEVAETMLRELVMESVGGQIMSPRAVVCVPFGATELERRALRECVEAAGIREAQLVEQPLAAGIGAGLDVYGARGCMVVDAGGGRTSVALMAMGQVVEGTAVRVGGEQLDQALVAWLRSNRSLLIGPITAETLRGRLGSTGRGRAADLALQARGRDLRSGLPAAAQVTTEEVRQAIEAPIEAVVQAIRGALERAPAELNSDIAATGILLVGGLAALPGLADRISAATGVPVLADDAPTTASVRGALDWATEKRGAQAGA